MERPAGHALHTCRLAAARFRVNFPHGHRSGLTGRPPACVLRRRLVRLPHSLFRMSSGIVAGSIFGDQDFFEDFFGEGSATETFIGWSEPTALRIPWLAGSPAFPLLFPGLTGFPFSVPCVAAFFMVQAYNSMLLVSTEKEQEWSDLFCRPVGSLPATSCTSRRAACRRFPIPQRAPVWWTCAAVECQGPGMVTLRRHPRR